MYLNSFQNHKKSDGGFTLLEALLALFVLTMISFLFLPLIRIAQKTSQQAENRSQIEMHLFMLQLQRSMKEVEFEKIENNGIYLREKDSKIGRLTKISQYKNMIRRQKNSGHEPLLMNVAEVTFTEENQKIKLDVTFLDGKKFENYLFFEE